MSVENLLQKETTKYSKLEKAADIILAFPRAMWQEDL
jgi:hypothetical protein